MIKKILSMLLVLSMLLTMLPMTVMAQEENTTNDIREEIIAFESLDETEKIVTVGTSLEDLELPEVLTVNVRTNPETVTDSVYGFEEETTVDIPVTWISQPEYDMDTEDNYVFTPVIEGYTVSAELPQINVTVEAKMAPMMMLSMGVPTEVSTFTELKNAINNATEDLNLKLTADIDHTGTTALTIPDTKSINITIDLNDKTFSSSKVEAIKHNGTGILTIEDNGEEGKGMIKTLAVPDYTITVRNKDAQLVINSGTIENQYGSNDGAAIYFEVNMMNSTIDINGGTINCLKGYGIYAQYNKIINIYDGTIKGAKQGIRTNSVLKIYGGTIEGTDETSNAIYTTGEVTVTGGTVKAVGTGATIDQRGSAKLNISGGTIENTGSGPAISSSLSSTNGSFTIGGNAEIISNNPDSDSGTIYVSGSQGSLLIAGAKVVNTSETGNGIFCENPIQANIRSGNPEIKGGNLAIKGLAPIVRLNMKGIASSDFDGEDQEDYAADKISSYKFLKFEPNTANVAQIGEMTYPTLQEAIDAVDDNTIIKLLENIALDETINTKSKSFTLDLNGKVIDGEKGIAIAHNAGKLTIKDDAGGGMIFSAGEYTIAMENEGAELEINNVTLENYYIQGYAEYNKGDAIYVNKGTLNINDSTIRSNENGVYSNESTIGIDGSNIDGNTGLYIRTKSVVNVIDSTVYGIKNGITNNPSGSVMNIDRSIIGSDNVAINTLWGTYTITDSTVESAGNEATIHCANNKVTLNIIGGTIENTGSGCAILEYPGKSGTVNSVSDITISGGVVITSQNPDIDSGTIYVWNAKSSFNLYGATVTNTSSTGNAIFCGDSLKVNIRNGNNLIYGGNLAIKGVAPIVRLSLKGMASSDFDGEDQEDYAADKISSYKFLKFEPKYVAQVVGGDTYTSLQEAIDVVDDNTTIKLLENIALDEAIDTKSKSFILDLNGKTIEGENGTAIEQNGGTMTIEDNVGTGMITSKGADSTIKLTNDSRLIIKGGTIRYTGNGTSTIHHNSTGNLEVKGGTVENTYNSNKNSAVIHSTGSGDVIVDGGTVKCNTNNSNMRVIYKDEDSNGDVIVSEGTVEALAGTVIANNGNGNVSISGGTVEAYQGAAIYNNNIGKITISGEAEIKSQSQYGGTIYLNAGTADNTVLEITGGTISNEYDYYGTAIYNNASGKISIQGGTCIIWGKSMAMNKLPLMGALRIMASTSHTDGTYVYPVNAEALTSDNITNYKYLKFEPATVPDAPTNVTTTAGDGKATVSFTAPAFDGGSAITGYIVKSYPGGITATGATTEIEVTGLTNGTEYTFTVTATNGVGESPESSASSSVIPKGNQTITFDNPWDQDFGTELTLSASASSGLTVTFTSETPEVCTVTSDGKVTFLKAGTATIKASQAGNVEYLAAESVTQSFTVNAVKPGAPTNVTATAGDGKATVRFTAPAFDGGSAITGYTVKSYPGGITATGTTTEIEVTGLTNGTEYTFTVTATNGVCESLESSTSISVTPKGNQTITFDNPGDQDFGTELTLSASASSGLAVTYTSETPEVCTVTSDGKVTFLKVGTATITVSQDGNGAYNPATPVTCSFTVNAVKPGAPTNVTATAGDGKATVRFTAPAFNGGSAITGYTVKSYPGGITATGATTEIEVTGLTNGVSYTFTVTATNGVGESLESSVSSSVTPKGNQTITFGNPGDQDFGTELTLSASASSGLAVTYTSEIPEVCTVTSDGKVTFLKAGTATIKASQAGNVEYLAAESVTQSFTVNAVKPGAPTDFVVTTGDGQLTLTWTAPADTGGSPITDYEYSINDGIWVSTKSTETSYTVTELTNGTSYNIKVRAVNARGGGEESISIEATPVKVTHTITATAGTGGSISPNGSVTVNEGESITFTITPDSNYSIEDVKVDGISLGKITSYTFSDVSTDHSIAVTFSYIGSGGRSSDNDRDKGSASSSNIINITPASPDNTDSPTQTEIKVDIEADENGNAAVNITGEYLEEAFNKAMEDTKENGNEQNEITVIFHVVTGGRSVSNVTVNLPKTVQETIISKKIVNTIVVVDNPNIRINMDLATVEEINRQANSDVNVTATKGDNSQLSEEAGEAIGNRPVFDLKVNYGNGRQVQNFGDGRVSVAIPYTLGPSEKAENICAVYIDGNGRVHWLTDSVYDSEEKVLRFSTNHFSTYGVGYKEEALVFTDIANHWAKEDIEFVVSRGLFRGTSETTFSPNTVMTRGMFVTVLGRLAKADVSSYKESSFTDVKSDAYYMGYIEWARLNNIIKGIGDGIFAPDESITREQMAVIMQNYAKACGFILPKVNEEKIFGDSDKISAYAKEAVQKIQMSGIIRGKDGNSFDPQGEATRAEVSAVLRRFVELLISNDAQTY